MKNHQRLGIITAIGLAAVTFASIPASAVTTESVSTQMSASAPVSGNSAATNLKWVRGTAVDITNNSGSSIKVGTATNTWDRAPAVEMTTVAANGIVSVADGESSTSGTSVFVRVTYDDGTSEQIAVSNPAVGQPNVKVRDAMYGVLDWQNAPFDSHNFSDNESWTVNLSNGHSLNFHRMSDDSSGHNDSKVWAVAAK